jgi:hypothetical protein
LPEFPVNACANSLHTETFFPSAALASM